MKKQFYNIFIGSNCLIIAIGGYCLAKQCQTFQILKDSCTAQQGIYKQIETRMQNEENYKYLDAIYQLEINSYEKYFPYYPYQSEFFNNLLGFLENYTVTGLQVTQEKGLEKSDHLSSLTYSITYNSSLDTSREIIQAISLLSGVPQIQHLTINNLDSEQVCTNFDIRFTLSNKPFDVCED